MGEIRGDTSARGAPGGISRRQSSIINTTFTLKKLISAFLLPLPIICLALSVGLLLLWFTRQQLAGKILLTFSLILLLICSLPFLPDYLVSTLEGRYPPLVQAPANTAYVVVLNGDQLIDAKQASRNQLGAASVARLLEGIRLYQALPQAKLLLSGGVIFGEQSGAVLMGKMARQLGVKPQDIILEAASVDTEQQGQLIKNIVQNKPFVVVTSANHMPRTMRIFAALHLHPVPAPCDYFSQSNPRSYGIDYLPDSSNLAKTKAVIHEYLGMLWLRYKSLSKDNQAAD